MPEKPRKQRCKAMLASKGRRCRKWALAPDPDAAKPDPQLCAIHALERGSGSGGQRCSAIHGDGSQCRQLAVRGSEPPLCPAHRSGTMPKADDPRRCGARTKAGTRCRNWATRESQERGKGVCGEHARGYRLPGADEERRCSALTKKGERCRSWAVGDSEPPLCAIHSGVAKNRPPEAADYARGRVCSATTLSGRRCRKWAQAHTDPPLCWFHAYPDLHPKLRHGYLRRSPFLPATARSQILQLAREGPPLAAEIALLRLKIRALLAYLDRPALSSAERLAATRLLVQALRLVARLLRTQQAVSGEAQGAAEGSAGGSGLRLEAKSSGWLSPALEELARQEAAQEAAQAAAQAAVREAAQAAVREAAQVAEGKEGLDEQRG